ncbi:1-acyl-sn-glycerol-3-phosphate acyltransferase [Chryseobacterium sp. HSC-36S06]|uniref:lysophospholipid acyltransferase family protein n=1 Tax=Chryseobacterium sp. HSC-36S06 TaxID=2910970 RepID=UPI00209D7DD0|nr:lysophospholipid acyltransferase family protein [Chryseobacterium sp. HSC-36S06]MCP2038949.1 1-acyl-sn-glycerol-3-phosphate acyltransferase [Chryseobacterium sp. HSC-36S06]
MTKLLNYIWRGWMIVLGAILTITLGIPVLLFSIRKEHYKYSYIFIRIWCYGMFYGMGFRYELIKLTDKKIDKNTQYVFISNHTSIMDVMLPCILMPDHPLCYVGKKELVKIPVFGIIYKRICVMVDRSSARSRADVYRRCAERMEEGQSIVIFPEGGVPDDTSVILDSFKDGAFTLASKHHSPLVVFTFVGLKEMFPFDHSKGHPGKVKIYLSDIISPDQTAAEMKTTSHTTIKKILENSI